MIDHQGAIKALTRKSDDGRPNRPGDKFIQLFRSTIVEIRSRRPWLRIKLVWVRAHRGIAGNEWADLEAKETANDGDGESYLSRCSRPVKANLKSFPKSEDSFDFEHSSDSSDDSNALEASLTRRADRLNCKITRWYEKTERQLEKHLRALEDVVEYHESPERDSVPRGRHALLNRHFYRLAQEKIPVCLECEVYIAA